MATSPSSSQSTSTATSYSFAVSSASPTTSGAQSRGDRRLEGNSLRGLHDHLQTKTLPAKPSPAQSSAPRLSISSTKCLLKPLAQPLTGPKRTEPKRHICSVNGCAKDFSCAYDRNRHVRDFHMQSDKIFKCVERGCGYARVRKDKVSNHCKNRGHGEPVKIDVGQGQNPAELAAMHEQLRKKGRRRIACAGCGGTGWIE